MNAQIQNHASTPWPTLANFTLPAKVLVTMVIMTMAIAMLGALGQVVVHDIIPTFKELRAARIADANTDLSSETDQSEIKPAGNRGDLFSEEMAAKAPDVKQAFYKSEQFIWTLKWTHIHLFGINMIFIFVGGITVFLNLSMRTRAWLVGLPFMGILVDIAAMWLKGYVSPHFFWLHIPGGGLFGIIFAYVSIRALYEMWHGKPTAPQG